MTSPHPIDETGTLVREGCAFLLRRDLGGTYRLELSRMPVDLVEKRVRVVGVAAPDGIVIVEGVRAA